MHTDLKLKRSHDFSFIAQIKSPNFIEVEKYNSTMCLEQGRGKFGELQ